MSLVSLGMLIGRVAVIPVAALAIVVVLAGSAQAATYPNPGRVAGDIGVHDPPVVKSSGGIYIVASTGDNIALKTSTDRISFRNAGVVWPNGAPWTTQYTGGSASLWAPDISFHNGQYFPGTTARPTDALACARTERRSAQPE